MACAGLSNRDDAVAAVRARDAGAGRLFLGISLRPPPSALFPKNLGFLLVRYLHTKTAEDIIRIVTELRNNQFNVVGPNNVT